MVSLAHRGRRNGSHIRRDLKRAQFETLEHRLVLDSTVVFNEIMYNPPGVDDGSLEWIEFHNQLGVNMEVSDWVLDGGVNYTFPLGTIVPGRGYIVVAADPAAFEAATGISGALGPWTGRLSNAGEELLLYNNDQRLMNSVDYGDAGDWPTAPDGSGATLTKAASRTASEKAESWTFSPEIGGTPGQANFVEPGSFALTDLLPESNPVRALVPLDGNTGNWIEPGFDDSSWTTGTTGVGFDARDDYDKFIGLDLDEPPEGQPAIPLQNVNQSVYIRVPFTIDTDMSAFDSLRLRMRFEDGFVAYLNGTEIAHANAPGRDGDTSPLTWFSGATKSNSDRNAVQWQDFNLTEQRDLFLQGENLLAIHGLNKSVTDNDLLFLPAIVGATVVKPEAGLALAINEMAAADSADFFVEITNTGAEPVDLNGLVLQSGESQYALPSQALDAGALLSINSQTIGFTPADGDLLILSAPAQEKVIDARRVTGRLRGRSDAHDGDWLYPDTATPGAVNSFAFHEDVVINEIMYHAFPEQLPAFSIAPTLQRTTLLPMDDMDWRFRESAAVLPADWASQTHAVDGAEWRSAQGPFGFSPTFADDFNTELAFPALNSPPFITYFFEGDFEFAGTDKPFGFELKHFVHGGAVFYVNGVEFHRFNMPEGEITADTPASTTLRSRNVGLSESIEIPMDLVIEGTNRLSVEVHRPSLQAIDVVFGAQVAIREEVVPRIPSVPYIESNEEWIELYNRGASPADLSGWTLRDAVGFEFPAGTMLGPGEYLVIANDADVLSAKYPTINVIGDFSGQLSNHDDRIVLVDANKNPADEVHYYESGRWAAFADGGGSSLELLSPNADNAKAEAWAASDETGKSEWQTFTFRKTTHEDIIPRPQFNELIFGLLDEGEFLIDDIQVVQDPEGAAIQVIQNGTFEGDTIGQPADKWRIIGTHQGTVVADPVDANNKALHVVVTGPHQYAHDYGETTFVDNMDILEDVDYEFSFRAKWLGGSAQLNTRLFFTRASHTTRFVVPRDNGTPGAVNSAFQANIGPTYAEFGHHPITPSDSQEVTVSVQAADPDGVASMALWWKVGDDWNTLPMTAGDQAIYTASIPPQSSGEMVQFYVEGTDTIGATSTFPAAGEDSRALYQVDDGGASRKPNDLIDTTRLIFLPGEESIIFPPAGQSNQMTNEYAPFTLVHNNEVFYDVGIRQVGSRFVRPNSGYKIKLHPDNAFYGVHDSIRVDLDRQFELVIKQMINQAAGSKSSAYDDIVYLVSPRSGHTHVVLLQLARFEALYLDEQFENGSSGTKFELDDVVFPTGRRGEPEGPKTGTGTDENNDIGVNSEYVQKYGDNPEIYRGHVLIKSQRAKDDYESIARFAQAIHMEGDELDKASQEVMDVDLWLRQYAIRAFVGDWDSYGFRRPKNLRIYVRPEDGKLIPLFWDADQANFTEVIYNRRENTSRMDEIRALPHNQRVFWGHMLDLVNRAFNPEYAEPWVEHYSELAGGAVNNGIAWNQMVDRIQTRTAAVLEDMENGTGGIAKVPFEITTNGGQDLQVDTSIVTLAGTGWVDIRQIRLQGSNQPLEVTWTDVDKWEVELPVGMGQNEITLETIDYQGNSLTTDSIVVTSSASNPVEDSLRITEVNYNPYDPTPEELAANPDLNNDDLEFIEVQNTGTSPINLLNVSFADGVDYTFPSTILAPGQYGVVVKNSDAFGLRYDNDVNVIGQFEDGSLNNNGERIELVDGLGRTLVQFEYGDSGDWPARADGAGGTLELIDPDNTPSNRYDTASSWQGSVQYGGSPDAAGAQAVGVVINEVLTNTDELPNLSDSIELRNITADSIDISGWYLSDSRNNLLKYQIPAGTSIASGGYTVFTEQQFNPTPDSATENHFALSGTRGDDVWLVIADEQGRVHTFVDDVQFGAASSGESLGRVDGTHVLAPVTAVTLGSANSAPRVGPVVISEINYDPGAPSDAAKAMHAELTSDDLEYLEVTNTASAAVDLAGWRIRGGIDYNFDAGNLGPGQSLLIVPFNPTSQDNAARLAAFRVQYSVADGMPLLGGYQGQLSNLGERIQLLRPGTPPADDPNAIPQLLEDQVVYDTVSPWPNAANGSGQTLTRATADLGSSAASWVAAAPTLGSANFEVTLPGDANMDGKTDQVDLTLVSQAGLYMTGQPATFEQGDWNGDGVFNQMDIVAALQAGAFSGGVNAKTELDAVDEVFGGLAGA